MYKGNSGETTILFMFTPCLGYLAPYKDVKAAEINQNQNAAGFVLFFFFSRVKKSSKACVKILAS